MENRSLFRALMILGIVANLAALVVFAAEQKQVTKIDSWDTYNSTNGEFSISYPKGWQTKTTGHVELNTGVKFFKPGDAEISVDTPSKKGVLAEFSKPNPLSKESPVKQEHESYLEIMRQIDPDFKAGDTTPLLVAGYESYGTTFTNSEQLGMMKRPVKGIIVTAWNGSNPIHFELQCPEDEYDALLVAFNQMLTTFKSTSPAPDTSSSMPAMPALPGL